MLPARPSIRTRLTAVAGERVYLWIYSAVSLGLLYWLIQAAGRAPFVPLWEFRPWQLWVPNMVMPLVHRPGRRRHRRRQPILLRRQTKAAFDPARPGITGLSRHPLLLAITLWATAHLVPNGDLAHVLLFGLFAAHGCRRDERARSPAAAAVGPDRFAELARNTSLLPAAAWLDGRARPGLDALPPARLAIAAPLSAAFGPPSGALRRHATTDPLRRWTAIALVTRLCR
jgi:uncharacterized membrane protein